MKRAYEKVISKTAEGAHATFSQAEIQNLFWVRSLMQQSMLDFAAALDGYELSNDQACALRINQIAKEMKIRLPENLRTWISEKID